MVYRGMDIGTAKPSRKILARIPHHLVDILEPTETYSAGRFAVDARDAVQRIADRKRLPILVGGTLLYLRAFRDGLATLPRANPAIRRRLDREAERSGWASLHGRLEKVDAAAASRISPTDRQRIQRALEVYELTGEPISALQSREPLQPRNPVTAVALVPADRGRLAQRIEQRFDAMVEKGFVDEGQGVAGERRSASRDAVHAHARLSADLVPSGRRRRLAGCSPEGHQRYAPVCKAAADLAALGQCDPPGAGKHRNVKNSCGAPAGRIQLGLKTGACATISRLWKQ